MKIVDCKWELANIGRRTVEISIEQTDLFDRHLIEETIKNYEYAVVKVPMAMPTFNFGLSEIGFICIETQMNISCRYDFFNFGQTATWADKITFSEVNTNEGLDAVVSNITPGMFSTDRISIDPSFSIETACKRYVNWLKSEFHSGLSKLISLFHENYHIGFMLLRIKGNEAELLLNGLYKPYQRKGLGILTPASPFLYAQKNGRDIILERTSISSNNIPVVKLYNKLNFQLDSQTYVFVKHIA